MCVPSLSDSRVPSCSKAVLFESERGRPSGCPLNDLNESTTIPDFPSLLWEISVKRPPFLDTLSSRQHRVDQCGTLIILDKLVLNPCSRCKL